MSETFKYSANNIDYAIPMNIWHPTSTSSMSITLKRNRYLIKMNVYIRKNDDTNQWRYFMQSNEQITEKHVDEQHGVLKETLQESLAQANGIIETEFNRLRNKDKRINQASLEIDAYVANNLERYRKS